LRAGSAAALAATTSNGGFGEFIPIDFLHFCPPMSELIRLPISDQCRTNHLQGVIDFITGFLSKMILTNFYICLIS